MLEIGKEAEFAFPAIRRNL